jgi:hypothetical protein
MPTAFSQAVEPSECPIQQVPEAMSNKPTNQLSDRSTPWREAIL